MWVSEVELSNFRSFASASIGLSKGINLVIGPNNSGKSTILKSVAWMQQGSSLSSNDLRLSH
jgi:predicted ATP-dependent endonuclease of OLD family